jgi:MFS family permease
VVAIFLVAEMNHEWIWRVTLGLGAVPAVVILYLRRDLPETAMWLIRQGRFRDAKKVSLQMYNDPLDMLPDTNIQVGKPRLTEFLSDLRRDRTRWNATVYSWIACFCQAGEFTTFAFYMSMLFIMVGVSSILGTDLMTMGVFCIAAIAGWVGPAITPRIGHRGISISGFSIVLASLLVAAWALYTSHVIILPVVAACMMWGHCWAATNTMTIPTMVAKPEYRGTASGFAYMFNKGLSFLGIFLFPTVFGALGQANSTLLIAIFPLTGLLAAIFILPEVYGYEQN